MTSRADDGAYVFTCRECGAEFIVDDGARDALLDYCCVVCGADVPPDAFEGRNAAGS